MARATPLLAVVSASSMEKHLGAASENIIWEYFNKKKKKNTVKESWTYNLAMLHELQI